MQGSSREFLVRETHPEVSQVLDFKQDEEFNGGGERIFLLLKSELYSLDYKLNINML